LEVEERINGLGREQQWAGDDACPVAYLPSTIAIKNNLLLAATIVLLACVGSASKAGTELSVKLRMKFLRILVEIIMKVAVSPFNTSKSN
jgi:hypothetical protein